MDDAGFVFGERSTGVAGGGEKSLTGTCELMYFFSKAH